MTPVATCEWCAESLPPGRPRKFCDDRCRKRASRAAAATATEMPPVDGPVTDAVRLLLVEHNDVDGFTRARSELAIAAARSVDAGSVPAMAQLRAVLDELEGVVDDEHEAFRASIQTPRVTGA